MAQLPLNSIVSGDCVAGMQRCPAGSVQLAFADPPFNIGYEYDVYQDRQAHQDYLEWSRRWIAGVHRVLAPEGTFWLAIGDEYAAELKLISQEVGFHCRSWVIWYYTFGVNCSRKFSRSHAHLFYFVKDPAHFTFREEELENRIPSARQLVYNDKRANPQGRLPDDTWIIRPQEVVGDLLSPEGMWSPSALDHEPDTQQTWTLRPQDLAERFQAEEDTWYFPRVAGTFKERAGFHGCQMPEQLLGRIIRLCSQPGDTVLDPFSGSATTLVVAKKLGRRHLGFELSEDYAKHGRDRLDQVCAGDPLSGSAEPTMSAPETFAGKLKQSRGAKHTPTVSTDLSATEQRYAEAQLQLTLQGVRAAFELAHAGYATDRLLADPELAAAFNETCRKLGVVGDPRFWNTLLLRLRKAGQLSGIPTTRQEFVTWEECDPYLFASEIAWREIIETGQAHSLDQILCDPVLTAEFDQRAQNYAPGYSVRELRLGALRLRKAAKTARTRAETLRHVTQPTLRFELNVAALDPQLLPEAAGVYGVCGADQTYVYVGETLNLRRRLGIQFGDETLSLWTSRFPGLRLGTYPGLHCGLAHQARLVGEHKPSLNLQEFA